MQIPLKPNVQWGWSRRLYYVVTVFLFIDVLNFLTCAVIALGGIAQGVSFPFPTWFRSGTDICKMGVLTHPLKALVFVGP
jgi:hypothetical protein